MKHLLRELRDITVVCYKGAQPSTSSSEQGGGKRVLEDFFKKSDHTVACSLGANGEKV